MNELSPRLTWIVLALFAATALHAGSQLTGRVVDAASARGVARLTVTLTPPAGSGAGALSTATNSNGDFSFSNVRDGRYLLDVYQGVTPLHRQVIDVRGTQAIAEIRLQRR